MPGDLVPVGPRPTVAAKRKFIKIHNKQQLEPTELTYVVINVRIIPVVEEGLFVHFLGFFGPGGVRRKRNGTKVN